MGRACCGAWARVTIEHFTRLALQNVAHHDARARELLRDGVEVAGLERPELDLHLYCTVSWGAGTCHYWQIQTLGIPNVLGT